MRTKNIIGIVLTVALFMFGFGCATEKEDEGKEAKLTTTAKVSRADAERIALAKVPGGLIKEGEIEKEKGKIIWSFDITTPGTTDITEIAVDAQTGEIVAVGKETAEQETKEKEGK